MSADQTATLIVDTDGSVRGIYSDLLSVHAIGEVCIERASHVEPNEHGLWWADLSPMNGPKFGPFIQRADALRSEIAWLEDYWLQCNAVPKETS